MPLVKSTVTGAVIAVGAMMLGGVALAAPGSTAFAPDRGGHGAAGALFDLAAAAIKSAGAGVPGFELQVQREDRRSDRGRGSRSDGNRGGRSRSDGNRGSRSDGNRGSRSDGNRGSRSDGGRPSRADSGRPSRSDGNRGGPPRGSSDGRRDDRASRSGGRDRYAGQRDRRGSDARSNRSSPQRAAPSSNQRQSYQQSRRDPRAGQRDYRRDANRGGRYDRGRASPPNRYYRPDRRRYSGHGPRRSHGYWHPQRNVFVYNAGFSPIGWLTVSYGYDRFPRGYIGDCEVVAQTFYRRGRRYEEVALLCYDDWGYGYIRPGSRRVYRTW